MSPTKKLAHARRASSRYDAVVIGSGFGGAVVAARLAEKGLRVAVLERGREWAGEDFPRADAPQDRWWWTALRPRASGRRAGKTHGLFEVVHSRRLSLLVASGLGGGSLVYANVLQRAPAEIFTLPAWPESITRATLDPYYDRVRTMLTPSPIPQELPKTARLRAAAERLGVQQRFSLPELAIYWGEQGETYVNRFGAEQSACIRCGYCTLGCHVHAKNTLDLNYLRVAADKGAEIFPLHEALHIEPVAHGYLVHFNRYTPTGIERDAFLGLRAVVVAAGTLNSNLLLLRSRDLMRTLPHLSPRLGHRFSDNGDFFGAILAAGDVQPAYGASVTAMLDYFDRDRFTVFEGGLPDFLAARLEWRLKILRALWRLRQLFARRPPPPHAPSPQAPAWGSTGHEPRRAVDSLLPLFFMGLDAGNGRLLLDKKGRLEILWEHTASQELFRRMSARTRELARALGAGPAFGGGWGLGAFWPSRRHLWGVHPLGGCRMGGSVEEGVVNENGEVFGYPGLYVADGSLIPTALAVPPALTIAALAEHIADGIR